jgi:23S rRNA maturation mini-RNase III
MFNKLAEIKLELILGAIVLAFVGYFVFNYFHKDKVIDQLKTTVIRQKVEDAGLKDQVKNQQASAVIAEAVTTQVKKDAQALQEKGKAIQKKTDTKVAVAEKHYQQLPPTPENTAAEDAATSKAIIDGMWETYCTVKPEAPECSANP